MRNLRTVAHLMMLSVVLAAVSITSAVAQTATPAVVINEIMQNPSAVFDSSGEWFELVNPGSAPVDIDGWTIRDDGVDSHVIDNGGPLVVPAGGFVVLGNNSDSATNGGLTVDYSYGSGWFLANGDDEVVLVDQGGTEVDRVNYDGGSSFPDPNGASMTLADPAADNNDGGNWCEASSTFGAGDLGTPGATNDPCGDGGDPDAAEVKIHEIQGSGLSTPLSGAEVTVEAIVTSLFQDDDVVEGFFVQEEDVDADADPATSEGVFVFCGSTCPADLAEGDLVTVTGQAGEFFGTTQINAAGGGTTIVSTSHALPTATPVDLPAPDGTDVESTFESVEAMVATFPDTLVVSEYFQLARFGQIVLTVDDRPHQFTHDNAPSVEGYQAFLDDLATRRIILEDDNDDQNDAILGPAADEPYPYPEPGLSLPDFFRGGDSITDMTGVMHWSFGAWVVRPIESETYTFDADNPRPPASTPVGGELQVASFNVLNYFTTIDETSSRSSGPCGPSGTLDCRGADSAEEFERQQAKIVAALAQIDADVVGLIEIENNATAVGDLVAALNGATAPGTYAQIDTGAIGTDAIKVGFIYKPASVSPVGDFAILDSSVDPRFIDTKSRPVLIQTFEDRDGARFTAAVNHLKSKGSPCDDVGDPDANDGQANCNGTRTQAAQALADYLATDPTDSGDADHLIIGDLNAYRMEDPIQALEAAGYADLVELFNGDDAYSFVFDGQLGYLDHALANDPLLGQITGATVWHVNADEVPLFDYNDDVRTSGEASFERESGALPLFAADAFRSSDHDPVIVGLDLNAPPVADAGGPYEVRRNGTVRLDGSGSTDADGDVLTYRWDFDADGSFDDATGPEPVFDAIRLRPGTYPVSLQVEDSFGHVDTDTSSVTIADTARPDSPPGKRRGPPER